MKAIAGLLLVSVVIIAGCTGAGGLQGIPGESGPGGPQGIQAEIGPAGPQGIQGAVGSGVVGS